MRTKNEVVKELKGIARAELRSENQELIWIK